MVSRSPHGRITHPFSRQGFNWRVLFIISGIIVNQMRLNLISITGSWPSTPCRSKETSEWTAHLPPLVTSPVTSEGWTIRSARVVIALETVSVNNVYSCDMKSASLQRIDGIEQSSHWYYRKQICETFGPWANDVLFWCTGILVLSIKETGRNRSYRPKLLITQELNNKCAKVCNNT